MSRHLFTSDLHLGHERVATIRGFSSVAEHDDVVLGTLGAIRHDEVIWILGDIVGTARQWPAALEALGRISGRKRLVLGNHDPAHPDEPQRFQAHRGSRRGLRVVGHCGTLEHLWARRRPLTLPLCP